MKNLNLNKNQKTELKLLKLLKVCLENAKNKTEIKLNESQIGIYIKNENMNKHYNAIYTKNKITLWNEN